MVADLIAPRDFHASMLAMDGGMMLYWTIATLACAGILHLPPAAMYQGYVDPVIDAWNWSFAPLDLGFSTLGLISVALLRRRNALWKHVALLSLALAFCAGLMAISFWALRGDCTLSWWLPNLLLIAVPARLIILLIGKPEKDAA